MNEEQFRAWLERLVAQEDLRTEQALDLLEQRRRFDEQRVALVREVFSSDRGIDRDSVLDGDGTRGFVAGFQADELLIGSSVQEVLAAARQRQPERMVYFEPIGFNPFGSALGTGAPLDQAGDDS